jgi:hypothetical protein
MGTIDQLLDAIELGHAVGSRRTGHYNHDSKRSTGPYPEPIAISEEPLPGPRVSFERFEDPQTGEFLYRKVAQG